MGSHGTLLFNNFANTSKVVWSHQRIYASGFCVGVVKVSVWKLQQTRQNLCKLQPANLVCALIPLAIPNLRGQHSCGVMISSQVERQQEGFKSWWHPKIPSPATLKNSGRVLACGTCGWFGPSHHQGLVALVANPVGRGRPRLWCRPIGWSRSSGVFLGGLAEVSSQL